MTNRAYYSTRKGRQGKADPLSLEKTVRLFINVFDGLDEAGYFQQAFGYTCVDGGTFGNVGHDQEAFFFRKLRKDVWPAHKYAETYTEDDLFDVIEVLHDLVAKPTEGRYHSFSNCGYHYHAFDGGAGRQEYRRQINEIVADYGAGFELSETGEILTRPEPGLEPLLETPVSSGQPEAVDARVQAAIGKFRRRGASVEDRLDAIRDLAAVLEYLRPEAKRVLESKDESDLFNIANNFAIRHHNKQQATKYDREVWYPWMFYFYLATIHAIVRLLERASSHSGSGAA